MTSTFAERTRQLEHEVGKGRLTATVTVDQIYAAPLEIGYWKSGPLAGVSNRPRHGGETHALRNSVVEFTDHYMRNLAGHALEPGGLVDAMIDNSEQIARHYFDKAPRETNALRLSANPVVTDDGIEVYNRPAIVRRLSKEELKHRHEFVPDRHKPK